MSTWLAVPRVTVFMLYNGDTCFITVLYYSSIFIGKAFFLFIVFFVNLIFFVLVLGILFSYPSLSFSCAFNVFLFLYFYDFFVRLFIYLFIYLHVFIYLFNYYYWASCYNITLSNTYCASI